MTLTIELEPEVERQLEIEAARLGVSKEAWTRNLLKSSLQKKPESSAKSRPSTIEEKLAAWESFGQRAQEYSKDAPLWSDEDISRDVIYGERGS